jgi:arabinose-5-phosphate isomerase
MIKDTGKKVLRLEAAALRNLVDRIDDGFVRAVDLLGECGGRCVLTGIGKSGLIATKIASTLASTGTPAFFLHAAEGVHGDLGMISRGDVVVAVSNSGETEELVRILPVLKRLSVPLISLVGKPNSTLAKNSDVVLDVGVKEEAGPFGLIPTASTTAALAMGDALAVALLEKRGLNKEDFAFIHPGGSIGKQLLVRVSDAMHTGAAVPAVTPDTPMKEVIMEMTGKKLGMTTVQGARGALAGIITDGDLRRIFQREGDPLSLAAGAVMIRDPKTISPDALGAKAVQVMEQYSITSLVAVEKNRRVAGVVHLHDLLKMGVV